MKKITAILLICMIAIGISPKIYADDADNVDDMLQRAWDLLDIIEVVPKETEFEPDYLGEIVDRASFAVYVARLLKADGLKNDKRYFSDLDSKKHAVDNINVLYEMGIFSSGGDGLFRPDEPVTYLMSVKALICMLGYGDYANALGGYPIGYLTIAQNLRLNKGIRDISGSLKLRDVIIMLYNAAEAYVYEVGGVRDDYLVYSDRGKNTFLEVYHDICRIQGIVTETPVSSLLRGKIMPENTIKIGEDVYHAPTFECVELLGYNVVAYFMRRDDSSQREIIYLYKDEQKNETMTIDACDFVSFNGSSIIYEVESGKERKVPLDSSIYVIKNNVAVTQDIAQKFDFSRGKITLIKAGSYDYNVVKIEEYEDIVIKSIDYIKGVIYGRLENQVVEYSEAKVKKFLLMPGEKEIDDHYFNIGDTLTVYRSEDNSYLKIYVSSDTVTGVISEHGYDDLRRRVVVTVNGKQYAVGSGLENYYSFDLNGEYVFYLNMFKEIVAVDSSVTPGIYAAYLYRMSMGNSALSNLKFKVFNEDNRHIVLECADKIELNGRILSASEVYASLLDSDTDELKMQLIRYKLNDNGKVYYMETADGEGGREREFTLKLIASGTFSYAPSYNMFYPKYPMHSRTKIFCIPSNLKTEIREGDFSIQPSSIFYEGLANYTLTFYKYDTTHPFIDYLVAASPVPGNIAQTTPISLVVKVTQGVTAEGEQVNRLNLLHYGYQIVETVADNVDVSNIEPGDIIRFAKGFDGRICKIEHVYDYNNGAVPPWAPQSVAYDTTEVRYVYGHISEKFAGSTYYQKDVPAYPSYLMIGYNSPLDKDEYIFIDRSARIMIYDPNRKGEKAYVGTFDEISAYKDVGEDYDRIVVHYNWKYIPAIVVYK